MKAIAKKLSRKEFCEFIRTYQFNRAINKLVIHHTWRPKKHEWNGSKSIKALENYYTTVKKWRSGPHLFIADDGIWLFSPMNKMGTHAGRFGNIRSIGIEVVGDYDRKVWSGETKENALYAIACLIKRLELNTEDIKFHRDYSGKSCPGYSITKGWIAREINLYEEKDDTPEWAKESMEWADENKLMSKQRPNEPITRAEFAVVLMRFFNFILKLIGKS